MIKIEEILFWVLILVAIGIAIWMLFGSPDLLGGLISIIIFIAGSEILLWKALFGVDKRTAVGFEKVKSKLANIENKLVSIESLVMKINQKLKVR